MATQDYDMPKDVVPPGDQTGVYYIPISNLPFNVSWQQIKDYVRQVCDVDHVEIFPPSTSGWVRVKGRDNFDAAFAHLNGKEFNGRAIIADGRNGASPILVRNLKMCKPIGTTNTRPSSVGGSSTATAPDVLRYATGGSGSYPDSSIFSSPTSTTSSLLSQVGPSSHTTTISSSYSSSSLRRHDPQPREYHCLISMPAARELMMPRRSAQQHDGGAGYMSNMSMASSSYMASPDAMSFSYDPMAVVVGGGFPHPDPYGFDSVQQAGYPPQVFSSGSPYPTSSGGGVDAEQTLYIAPPPPSYAVQPPAYNDYYLPPPPATASLVAQMSNMAIGGGESSDGVIYTEQRGVYIRDISRRASVDQIRNMIREVAGPEAVLINTIKVPMQDGAPRGHAFVHVHSASLARRLVDCLHGVEFKGRRLQVRLMKEGDTIGGSLATATATAATSSSASSKHRSSGKKHHHYAVGGGGDRRRTERRPEKSTPSSSSKIQASSSSKTGPLVVDTPVTASKEKHGKMSAVVIANGSSAGCM